MTTTYVVAHYVIKTNFEIPAGVDLNGDKVAEWNIKNDTLYISYTDGRFDEIIPVDGIDYVVRYEPFKRPDHISFTTETPEL
tara:strand:- start:54 stop:299 length:246 start_codon:yes stop_codon:yes gene_type:complete